MECLIIAFMSLACMAACSEGEYNMLLSTMCHNNHHTLTGIFITAYVVYTCHNCVAIPLCITIVAISYLIAAVIYCQAPKH